MPYDKDGKFYTTRIEDDLKGDDALGRLYDRSVSARKGAKAGVRDIREDKQYFRLRERRRSRSGRR